MFYLGSDNPAWLTRSPVPLFVSDTQLAKRRTCPPAARGWALDSGGFTMLSKPPYRWTVTPTEYVDRIARYVDTIGHLSWAAPQDWMAEPFMVERTGLSVRAHQDLTITSVLELRALHPAAPIIPVLQGWSIADYMAHVDAYTAAGIDLTDEPVVGLGSVCRRQATGEAAALVAELAGGGLRLHGFGVSLHGLRRYGWLLESADSMAWSYYARMIAMRNRPNPAPMIPGHEHRCCNHCLEWALRWREDAVAYMASPVPVQLGFVLDAGQAFDAPPTAPDRA